MEKWRIDKTYRGARRRDMRFICPIAQKEEVRDGVIARIKPKREKHRMQFAALPYGKIRSSSWSQFSTLIK